MSWPQCAADVPSRRFERCIHRGYLRFTSYQQASGPQELWLCGIHAAYAERHKRIHVRLSEALGMFLRVYPDYDLDGKAAAQALEALFR